MTECGHVSPIIYLRSARKHVCRACFEQDCSAVLLVGDYNIAPPRCPDCGRSCINMGGWMSCVTCGTEVEPAEIT